MNKRCEAQQPATVAWALVSGKSSPRQPAMGIADTSIGPEDMRG